MNDVADNVEVAAEPATEAPVLDRPEWLPQKFETPEAMATSYGELESKLGQDRESIKNQLMQELESEALANRPDSVGEYKIPEGVDEGLAVDNDLFQWWANHSYENGYNQEEFEDGITKYAEFIQSTQPDLEAERVALGENASIRIEAANQWANGFFPAELHDAFLMMGQTATGIKALEYMQSQVKQPTMNNNSQPSQGVTIEKLRAMQMDPKYHDPVRRDPSFVKEVDQGFARLFPT